MRTATITEARNSLSALLDRVKGGEPILILDRGVPVARLEPVSPLQDPSGRVRRLERAGVVRLGDSPPPLELIHQPPPRAETGASAVAALIDERRTGR